MNLHMTGHHLEITPAIRDYVHSKMTRINRHFDHVIDVNMILSVEKLRQKIEASVHMSGKDIFAESADDDMYAAIDFLVDKLDRQIVKHKEKIKNKHAADAPKRGKVESADLAEES
jgi:putative sigma-54 modulation protein